ncbi:hypothetical protein Btru_050404 [Bulinus truncatus]|nr:hypothetical protein Btru_050404 [Bulinus truncatus]
MEEDGNVVYQGEVFKLSEPRKRLIGTKPGSWKLKYLIFRLKYEKPILEYHKKKPKLNKKHDKTLLETVELWPSYKVEKLKNARGRTFVCEITSPDHHIFLSLNEEKEIDILVFLFQVQIRLKSNIRDDLITVLPDDSECLRKIGAVDCKCVLHASPWGLTLALEKTRALLAQWPLKSIRYYEVPAPGHFNIEAGRVAPMGEGLFQFKTQTGDEDFMYDLLDSYILNTLDRVKPTQKGTPEEIEDYIREHECLHSLTTIGVCSRQEPEIRNILQKNWNLETSPSVEDPDQQRNATASLDRNQVPLAERAMQSSSLVINLERPRDLSLNLPRNAQPNSEVRVVDRPPPLPSRSTNGGRPRRSSRRDHSIPRKVDVTSPASECHSLYSGSLDRSKSGDKGRSSGLTVFADHAHGDLNQQHHHTEFYNLSSPNMKIRKTKSPIVTKNVNKVGRAEYLMSQQQSGVKSPTLSVSDDKFSSKLSVQGDSPDGTSDYFSIDHKFCDPGYAGHSHTSLPCGKLAKTISGSEVSVTSGSSSLYTPSGYVNLQDDIGSRGSQSHHKVPTQEVSSAGSVPHYSRNISKESSGGDQHLSSPAVRHIRQRSADELSHGSTDSFVGNSVSISPLSHGPLHARPESEASRRISEDADATEKDIDGKHFPGLDSVDNTVSDWLMSARCEDLSDHMKTVIYDDNNNGDDSLAAENVQQNLIKEGDSSMTLSSSGSTASNDRPPLPFTGLKKFHDNTDVSGYRDRSRSFGYMNLPNSVSAATSAPRTQSSAPSAHLIRKMVNVRAKQETLRKSLSNPNFLNLGSKEHLFNLKAASGGANSKLDSEAKQKSKSFSSLFPAIKKAFSRESLGHSRSTTPERRSSRSSTPERRSSFSLRRRASDQDSNFKRGGSYHSIGEMTIKGIRMTERSRSFRKVRGAKSVEILSKDPDDMDMGRLSSATTASSPPTDGLRDINRISASSRMSEVNRHTDAGRSSEISTLSDRRQTSSLQSRTSAPLTESNPNYITTASIELTPSVSPVLPQPVDQPPPLPARVKLDSININQVVISPHGESSHHAPAGYLNLATDMSLHHSNKPSLSCHVESPELSVVPPSTKCELAQQLILPKSSSPESQTAYMNYSKTDLNIEKKLSEANTVYENAPEVDITVKKTELPQRPRRPLVSDLVAQMEKNCIHPEPNKLLDKSPKVFRRNVTRDPEGETVKSVSLRMSHEPRSDAPSRIASNYSSQSGDVAASAPPNLARNSGEIVKGQNKADVNQEDEYQKTKKNVQIISSQSSETLPAQGLNSSPTKHTVTIPKPFQPMPFKRQEHNGFRPVKSATVVKHPHS